LAAQTTAKLIHPLTVVSTLYTLRYSQLSVGCSGDAELSGALW
jgi:hypothetical protein